MRYVVVTGTGTGVGKTWVSCALAKELAKGGARVVAIKPVETGGSGDGELLAASTGQPAPKHALVRLRDPLTPALAAEREGVALDFDALVRDVVNAAEGYDHAVVEGAGGLLSPITYEADATTLANRLEKAAVVLVASDALGTLSAVHTAVQCLFDAWLVPSAIVLVEPAERDASTGTNAAVLRRRLAKHGDCASRIFEIARVDGSAEGGTSRAAKHADGVASIARSLRPAV